jgi:hypothetical protein
MTVTLLASKHHTHIDNYLFGKKQDFKISTWWTWRGCDSVELLLRADFWWGVEQEFTGAKKSHDYCTKQKSLALELFFSHPPVTYRGLSNLVSIS